MYVSVAVCVSRLRDAAHNEGKNDGGMAMREQRGLSRVVSSLDLMELASYVAQHHNSTGLPLDISTFVIVHVE